MELEITGKVKVRPRKLWDECIKKDLEQYGLRRGDAYDRKKRRERTRAKVANLTSRDNGIKTDVSAVWWPLLISLILYQLKSSEVLR